MAANSATGCAFAGKRFEPSQRNAAAQACTKRLEHSDKSSTATAAALREHQQGALRANEAGAASENEDSDTKRSRHEQYCPRAT